MNFGSCFLQIVIEPASDCCRYVGNEDTIEQMLMVQFVVCSCHIVRDEHCSVSRLFSYEAGSMSVVIDDSAVNVEYFGRRPCWAGCTEMCVSILGSRSSSCVLSAGHRRLIWRQSCQCCCHCRVLGSGMIIALCHNSVICQVEIDRLKIIVS